MPATPIETRLRGRRLGVRDQVGRCPGRSRSSTSRGRGSRAAGVRTRRPAIRSWPSWRPNWTGARRSSTARSWPSMWRATRASRRSSSAWASPAPRRSAGERGDPGHVRRLRPSGARRREPPGRAARSAAASCWRASSSKPTTGARRPITPAAARSSSAAARARGLEGLWPSGLERLVAGARSRDRLKIRARRDQEPVIGGRYVGRGAQRPRRLAPRRLLGRDPRGGRRARSRPATGLRRRRRHRLHGRDARSPYWIAAPARDRGVPVRAG